MAIHVLTVIFWLHRCGIYLCETHVVVDIVWHINALTIWCYYKHKAIQCLKESNKTVVNSDKNARISLIFFKGIFRGGLPLCWFVLYKWIRENHWDQPLKVALGLLQWTSGPSTGKYNNTPSCGMLPEVTFSNNIYTVIIPTSSEDLS